MSANDHGDPDDTAPCRECQLHDLRGQLAVLQQRLEQALSDWCGPDHRYVQHRDGLPPWCRYCRYRSDGWPVA